ncbi:hypothetical protein GYM62_13580 [Algoriphagus sp. NBT04N3]|jgi:hypothetical protein|uniref:hypothetical protein n=1 Tax=Algoriphagus sp. NBT04N3 TaxID=2705473 RepID=UPI001C6315F8|nr:hypothetical protein [Algoriphagus sp. NBT04N3]QYH39763.1 hypothetical protein GYM62_13580 [Algoriphagus sp. NBT04N3]
MKNLPQHTPKSDSWDKIMQQQDFDAQLDKNLNELPSYSPSDLTWNRIEKELDNEKIGIGWKPFLIAASITGLLLLGIYQIRQGNRDVEIKQNSIESVAENSSQELVAKEGPEITSPKKQTAESPNQTTKEGEIKKIERVPEFIPQVNKEDLLDLKTSIAVKGIDLEKRGKFIPPTETAEETYHSVAISWGLQVKPKIRIGSGPRENWGEASTPTAKSLTKSDKKPLTIIIK